MDLLQRGPDKRSFREIYRDMAPKVFGSTRWKYVSESFVWTAAFTAANTGTGASAANGSAIDMTTGANAGSVGGARPASISATFRTPNISTTKPFLLATRIKLDTTPDAQAELWFGMWGDYLRLGVVGSVSTTKYVAHFDSGAAPTLTSTVSIDTSYHSLVCWKDSNATTWFSVDGEPPLSSATAAPTAAGSLALVVKNGTTAAEQSARFECFFAAYGVEGT